MQLIKQGIFATPENSKALEDYIELFPSDQKIALYTVAGMAWNLACKTVETANKLEAIKKIGRVNK